MKRYCFTCGLEHDGCLKCGHFHCLEFEDCLLNVKIKDKYEQVLGGGFMERRDWKGYDVEKEQDNLNIQKGEAQP